MISLLRLIVFVTLLCLLAVGCSRQESGTAQAPTPTARQPSKTLSDPLTDQEVRTFLAVLETLPGKAAPEFLPLSQVTASDRLTAAQLADLYRQEFRAMFDAARHGGRWRKSDQLMETFADNEVTPEDFAALMIRMSCAVAAGKINSQIDLRQVSANADAQVARLVQDIGRLDRALRTKEVIAARRQALDMLQNYVAYSEFTRILQQVPAASLEVVARHRPQLDGHLPQTGNLEQFEQTIEPQIVPTSFEQNPSTSAR